MFSRYVFVKQACRELCGQGVITIIEDSFYKGPVRVAVVTLADEAVPQCHIQLAKDGGYWVIHQTYPRISVEVCPVFFHNFAAQVKQGVI